MLLIETVVNRYLAMDPEVLEKLAAYSGKVIKLEVTDIKKDLFILPDASGLQILLACDEEPDTTLRGSSVSLFKMGLLSNVSAMLLKGEVEISGDTRLGHQFKNIFSQMDVDWAEPLARLVGDGLAYQLQQSGKKIGRWSRDTVRSVSLSASEYLQEESRDLVTDTELEMFNEAVDTLRDDVDRLQARIKNLGCSIAESNSRK
ncbi:MAG: SCP2 sterol-binding domain-containing protein [Proteobacteria bacterium]|nr:SCP2 sterol-binding domain-containing protein [Pseudomonadota bacterium]